VEYGDHMTRMMTAIDPLLDEVPLHAPSWTGPHKSIRRAWKNRASLKALLSAGEHYQVFLAACGVSHCFKLFSLDNCSCTLHCLYVRFWILCQLQLLKILISDY